MVPQGLSSPVRPTDKMTTVPIGLPQDCEGNVPNPPGTVKNRQATSMGTWNPLLAALGSPLAPSGLKGGAYAASGRRESLPRLVRSNGLQEGDNRRLDLAVTGFKGHPGLFLVRAGGQGDEPDRTANELGVGGSEVDHEIPEHFVEPHHHGRRERV